MSEKIDFKGWVDFDWFIELDSFEFFIRAIEAWNDKNPNIGETWKAWPEDIEAFSMIPKEITSAIENSSEDETSIKLEWMDFDCI